MDEIKYAERLLSKQDEKTMRLSLRQLWDKLYSLLLTYSATIKDSVNRERLRQEMQNLPFCLPEYREQQICDNFGPGAMQKCSSLLVQIQTLENVLKAIDDKKRQVQVDKVVQGPEQEV